jgi:hypothetical protein
MPAMSSAASWIICSDEAATGSRSCGGPGGTKVFGCELGWTGLSRWNPVTLASISRLHNTAHFMNQFPDCSQAYEPKWWVKNRFQAGNAPKIDHFGADLDQFADKSLTGNAVVPITRSLGKYTTKDVIGLFERLSYLIKGFYNSSTCHDETSDNSAANLRYPEGPNGHVVYYWKAKQQPVTTTKQNKRKEVASVQRWYRQFKSKQCDGSVHFEMGFSMTSINGQYSSNQPRSR